MAATLPKVERLSGRTAIASLMGKGRWERSEHLRCCYLAGNGLEFSRLMVSVPKKFFKRAVKRNLLKRRMREAYRLQKDLLGPGYDILINYNFTELLSYDVIREEVAGLLGRISGR